MILWYEYPQQFTPESFRFCTFYLLLYINLNIILNHNKSSDSKFNKSDNFQICAYQFCDCFIDSSRYSSIFQHSPNFSVFTSRWSTFTWSVWIVRVFSTTPSLALASVSEKKCFHSSSVKV